jgi:D-galacturonate reductase
MADDGPPRVLMVGAGEYTTGVTSSGQRSGSDKKAGVVALAVFDMAKRGLVAKRAAICGRSASPERWEAVRDHLKASITDAYTGLVADFDQFPKEVGDEGDNSGAAEEGFITALREFARPGDLVTVVTPDDTHFRIAKAAIERGCHVLLTKPPVKTLADHAELVRLARARGVHVQVEYHKRFDPIYADAVARARDLGDFSFFQSYMSQPKAQLETFRAWAGSGSDISYYLNSHHIDVHAWMMRGRAVPTRVTAVASSGIASSSAIGLPAETEDTITLVVVWRTLPGGRGGNAGAVGTATYTASWVAPKADVHSQQRFFCMMHEGEVTVSQSHRGYTASTDAAGFASVNPLYMRYTPDPATGEFVGQSGYGYASIESFVKAASAVRSGERRPGDFDASLPTLAATATTTAILEAGRRSLDAGGSAFEIVCGDDGEVLAVQPAGGEK